ncbi:PD-(D/E)XK nuclease family protein, partial [Balneolaceae bacterium ANBcel3]|nr:PD-(D/E)XK nuclease family protein [Balneolaceae bacterium ANBcel3]
FEYRTQIKDKKVLVRGIIDLLVTDEAGNIHIVDFKTGPVVSGKSTEEQNVRSIQSIKDAGYEKQIELYKNAAEKICGRTISAEHVWLLCTYPDPACGWSLQELLND